MSVYNSAHNLARAIKNSKEYKDYYEKHKVVFQNSKTKEMVEDYRKKAMDVQMIQMSGKKVDRSKIDQLKKLEVILMENNVLKEFFMTEMKFGQMMNDVYKILGDSVEIK